MANTPEVVIPQNVTSNKVRNLVIGIIMDLLGNISYFIPGAGEILDVVWAPISAFVMKKLYPTPSGKVASVVSFIEEAIPGLDIIPTFTIMWFYTYILKKNK